MKAINLFAAMALVSVAFPVVSRAEEEVEIPDNIVAVNGVDKFDEVHRDVMRALFAPSDWHYEAEQAPRFLFLDKKGRVAFGIGGKLLGTLQYDFDGSCPINGDFVPQEIPVPQSSQQKTAFDGTANNSILFFRLVGHNQKVGDYGMYIETKFSGGPSHNLFAIKQAWVSWNYMRFGKATAIFNDNDAAPFTIDEQGPAGGTCGSPLGLQWTPRFGKDDRFTAGVAIEVPLASYTLDGNALIGNNQITHATFDSEINQRVPDIPAYIQYSWDGRASRVRLSAVLRNLSYHDMMTNCNRFATGWGVGLSGNIASIPRTTLYYQMVYGHGIGEYVNDLSGYGYDLVPDFDKAGRMKAPGSLSWLFGAQFDITSKCYVSAVYSAVSLHNQRSLGDDAYKQGQYLAATFICKPVTGLALGLEYLWGKRTDVSCLSSHANRLMLMASYSF